MIFRQAREEEFEGVWALIGEGRAALAALGIDQWQGASPTRERIRADLAAGFTYVAQAQASDAAYANAGAAAVCEGQLLGTLAFICGGEPDYAHVLEGAWLTDSANLPADGAATYAVCHRVAVSSTARRRGVATFMLRSAADLARSRGMASLRVDTHEGNAPMQRTLARAGLVRCCVVEIGDVGEPTRRRLGFELVF